ncbi:MAG TPA: BatA and WFA domain-containing protein [Phycisphaerae bacterium]|nr:BatA and WFA domain-containing protein [Phycisphaerae bacterium]
MPFRNVMIAMAFQFAPILWAGGAAAGPLIIHLILRTKARKIKFPAIEFVRKTHQANINMHKLKHLILLLMRMAAIAMIVLLIARWSMAGWGASRGGPGGSSDPAAVVVVLDNSGSMGYRPRRAGGPQGTGETLLAHGQKLVQQLTGTLPAGSRVAVLSTSTRDSPDIAGGFITDTGSRRASSEQVAAVEGTWGHESLAGAIRQGADLLNNVKDLGRKEMYIVSDMTAQAWRDGSGLNLVADADKRFIVINCPPDDSPAGAVQTGANASIGDLKLGSCFVPAGVEVAIDAEVHRPPTAPELSLVVELDGRSDRRKILKELGPGRSSKEKVLVRPDTEGIVSGKVLLPDIEGVDPLAMDNERHFTLCVGQRAMLLAVQDRTAPEDSDATTFLMRTAIAPEKETERVHRASVLPITSDRLDGGLLKKVDIVMLANVSSLSQSQWNALKSYVEDGGKLWIVSGALLSPQAYNAPHAQALMPVEVGPLENVAGRIGWKMPAPGQEDVLLEPFVSGETSPLTDVRCSRRFGVRSIAEGARVILSYEDDVPAIVRRDVGYGGVTFWNFSPAAEFSNLAGMGRFMVLVQRSLELMLNDWTTTYFLSDAVTVPVPAPRRIKSPSAEVSAPGGKFQPVAERDPGGRSVTIRRVDRVGQWRVRFTAEGQEPVLYGFSVNVPYAESNLKPAAAQDVADLFPPERLQIVTDIAQITGHSQTHSRDLDLTVPVLLAFLVAVTAESFFANRFYRRPARLPVGVSSASGPPGAG